VLPRQWGLRSISSRPNGLTINEINHTMEFRNSITTTGVNIPEKMVDFVLRSVAISQKKLSKQQK
jgi:glutathione synthase/RimK-type ligase-like ATP-grasp enzyme